MRENALFIIDKKLNLEEKKRTYFFIQTLGRDNHQETYEVLEKHNWDEGWANLYKYYPEVYDTFKDRKVDGETLYKTSSSAQGDLAQIIKVFS